ncbi:MAG: hypothetical protein WCI05_14485, partial [Myxococcales bacterium]
MDASIAPNRNALIAHVATRQAEGRADASYHVRSSSQGLVALNPAHRFSTTFNAGGFDVASDAGGWHAQLTTQAIRCGTARMTVEAGAPLDVPGEPNRVRVERHAGSHRFEEWALNGPLGVEQGFTFAEDPCEGYSSELVVDVGVEGMTPVVQRQDVELRDEKGVVRATYGGLYAVDASGAELDARLSVGERAIALHVNTAGAKWPVTIDPLVATQQKLVELSTTDEAWYYAHSLAVDGDIVVVGAPGFTKPGVSAMTGAAYVYTNTWTNTFQPSFETRLGAADLTPGGHFGWSVALSGNTALVGSDTAVYVFVRTGTSYPFVWVQQAKLPSSARVESLSLSGDTAIVGTYGTASVYVRSGTSWSLQQTLIATSSVARIDGFGSSVSVSGNIAVVGAPNTSFIGSADSRGTSYVFVRSGTTWSQQAELKASDGAGNARFGFSVSVSGSTIFAGAPFMDNMWGTAVGAAYVFSQSGATWSQQPAFYGESANDQLGTSVAVSGDRALVGVPGSFFYTWVKTGKVLDFARSGGTWSPGSGVGPYSGVAGVAGQRYGTVVAISGTVGVTSATTPVMGYAMRWTGTRWEAIPSFAPYGDNAGTSVAISGDTVLVGAPRASTATNSTPVIDYQGATLVYTRSGTYWSPQATLVANDATPDDALGTAVSLSGNTAVVGTRREKAYVFVRNGTVWSQQFILRPSDPVSGLLFGWSVSVDGDTALIGTFSQGSAPCAAYVFVRTGSVWTQQQKIVPTDGSAASACFFGGAVAVAGNTALIGSESTRLGSSGGRGSVYMFVRSGTTWTQQARIDNPDTSGYLGTSVALDGDTAVATNGSSSVYVYRRAGTTWTLEHNITASGEVALRGETLVVSRTLFVRAGTTWSQQATFTGADTVDTDNFGSSVALDDHSVVIGAPGATVRGT